MSNGLVPVFFLPCTGFRKIKFFEQKIVFHYRKQENQKKKPLNRVDPPFAHSSLFPSFFNKYDAMSCILYSKNQLARLHNFLCIPADQGLSNVPVRCKCFVCKIHERKHLLIPLARSIEHS
jgi:hypothetical protein